MRLVVADDHELLLHHRDDLPGVAHPGRWAGFGGAVEDGENPLQVVRRHQLMAGGRHWRRGAKGVRRSPPRLGDRAGQHSGCETETSGRLPHDKLMRTIELYGTRVVPTVRGLLEEAGKPGRDGASPMSTNG